MTNVLVVCMANVCRSPMAASVLRKLAIDQGLAGALNIGSAGVRVPWPGTRIDPRADAALRRGGYTSLRSRSQQVTPADFQRIDLALAMDHTNLEELRELCPPEQAHKLHLFLDFTSDLRGQAVPDPYYGDARGFDNVLALCEAGARGLLATLAARRQP